MLYQFRIDFWRENFTHESTIISGVARVWFLGGPSRAMTLIGVAENYFYPSAARRKNFASLFWCIKRSNTEKKCSKHAFFAWKWWIFLCNNVDVAKKIRPKNYNRAANVPTSETMYLTSEFGGATGGAKGLFGWALAPQAPPWLRHWLKVMITWLMIGV